MKRIAFLIAVMTIAGCGRSSDAPPPGKNGNIDGSRYLLAQEPAGAQPVKDVRAKAKNDDEITIVGRIGGNVNPWVEGRASFWIVDLSLRACSDIAGDECPTPWDY